MSEDKEKPTLQEQVEYLQKQVRKAFLEMGLDERYIEALDHEDGCTCDICLAWWLQFGPEEDGSYGPFSAAAIKERGL